jgi:hypothetical protein
MTVLIPGQRNDQGELLLFDRWAEETDRRIRAWLCAHGRIRLDLTLASYRAADLRAALDTTGAAPAGLSRPEAAPDAPDGHPG